MSRHRIAHVAAPLLAAVLGLAAFAPGTAHAALNAYRLDSSSVGIADGQVIRLNAYFVTDAEGRGLPPGPCRVTLRFLDASGATAGETTVVMRAGRAASFDYRPALRPGQRATLRAEVVAERDEAGLAPRVLASVEVYESSTGRTTVASPGTTRAFDPQLGATGDLAPFGAASQQVAHVTAAYVGLPSDSGLPPGPCRVTMLIYSGDGVVASREQTLAPGETAALDFAAGALPTGVRRRLWATVVTDGREQGAVLGAVEIVDGESGKSSVLFPADMVQSWGWE